MVKPVWISGSVASPFSWAMACSTPCRPMLAGSWATSAWTVPALSASTWAGPASKPTTVMSVTPAWRMPVAAP